MELWVAYVTYGHNTHLFRADLVGVFQDRHSAEHAVYTRLVEEGKLVAPRDEDEVLLNDQRMAQADTTRAAEVWGGIFYKDDWKFTVTRTVIQ